MRINGFPSPANNAAMSETDKESSGETAAHLRWRKPTRIRTGMTPGPQQALHNLRPKPLLNYHIGFNAWEEVQQCTKTWRKRTTNLEGIRLYAAARQSISAISPHLSRNCG